MNGRRYFPAVGTPSVKRCVEYLRHIGVEVGDETAQQWKDAESVHRYLRKLRTKMVRQGVTMRCRRGHEWSGVKMGRGKGMRANNAALAECPECDADVWSQSTEWVEMLDGSIRDYRPRSEQWKPRA